MSEIKIIISSDFSDAPGARYISDGDSSGEEFYNKLLKPKFQEAQEQDKNLFIDMDGTYGYATSFISEAFGSLSNEYGVDEVLSRLTLKSNEDEKLKDYIIKIIKNPDAR